MTELSAKFAIVALLALVLLPLPAASTEPRTIAVLPFDFMDDSLQGDLEGPQPEDLERARMIGRLARKKLDAQPEFRVVSNEPAEALIEKYRERYQHMRNCNGCELKIAEALDADLIFLGWVQKISNLIINVNGVIREAGTRRDMAGASVDMRSNTDEAWTRATLALITDRIPSSYAATVKKLNAAAAAAP